MKAKPRTRFDVLGKPRRRVDGRAKVTGLTKFADDIVLPRMLHMKILRSPHPHAVIESIDFAKAAAYPGVHLVLTGKDFPITFGILPVSQDEYPLANERVRYVGDPVAAVVAKDEQTAWEACELIEVKYRPLATISSPEEALATPEPRIHEHGEQGNIHRLQAFEFGDVDEALAKSAHVFEDLFFYEGNTHLPIEQHAAVAAPDGEGKLTLWSSTQVPHYIHRALARALRMNAAHIRVIACPNGGGFGGKCDLHNHEIVVSRAALKLGRPVKICLNREEVFYMHRGRHPVLMRMRTGVTKEGKLTGMHVQTLLDGGGYGSYGTASTFYTGALQTVTYELPRYKFDACRTFTNKPPCGPKRGHGTPQPRFGQEVQLDKIAEKLKLDPADLRLGMVAKPNSLTANWLKIGSIGLEECIRRVVAASDWKKRFGKLPDGKGLGIACGSYLCGAGLPIYWNKMPQSGVQLLLDRSGQVTAFCGATEIGQGSDDVLAAIIAEVLGIDPYDAGGPRFVFEPRHGDDGQRRDPGGRGFAREAGRCGRRAVDGDPRPARVLAGTGVPRRGSLQGHELHGGGGVRGNQIRHAGLGGLIRAAARPRTLQGRGRWAVPGLFVLGLRGRGGGGQGHRLG
jgi:4-hydroxybenzoyl-CoA reductase subunit alpha